ncbi:hypothetical protein [Paenibacillus sp. FJAT-26967]|uniref:hypothetical protein n=1 Tax=Paenibacillus sp. FJAT-26967 TaxID=1729690 RepID=UPI000A70B58E|nr:hypothetical protein [Paenibacillus sp. FJAT-26967]
MTKLKNEEGYTKEQFLGSGQFTLLQKDVLAGLLSDDERYTWSEIEQIQQEFYLKEVQK